MKLLVLGVNDIREPVDGLPEYLRYLSKHFGYSNKVTFFNLSPLPNSELVEDTIISENVRQILIHAHLVFQDINNPWNYVDVIRVLHTYMPNDIDMVIMNDYFWCPILAMFDINVPVVYFNHLFYTKYLEVIGNPEELITQSEHSGMTKLSDCIIANSFSSAKDIRTMFPEVNAKLNTVPLGVDKKIYADNPALESKAILYMGRLDQMKGLQQFLNDVEENFEMLQSLGLKVYVAGKGHLLQRVIDMHYAGKIEYLYSVSGPAKFQLLKDVKYMVFPSIYEPYGLSLNEGLSSGKICLATSVGGHKDQIQNMVNGVFVKENQWIKTIAEVEGNKKLQKKIVKNAHNSANDIDVHFEKLEEVLSGILGA